MPATFPSHAAAVLPLKVWRPDRFDGVALVIGAAAPDLPYAFGSCQPPYTYGHTWWGVLASVPATVAAARSVRWAAPTVAAHLPPLGPLSVADYGALGGVRHPWWVTAGSALLGAAGAAAWLAVSVHIGRRRRVAAWHGPAPAVPRRRRLFWTTAAAAAAAGTAAAVLAPATRERVVTFLPALPRPAVLSARLLATVAGSLLAATAAHRSGQAAPPRTGGSGRAVPSRTGSWMTTAPPVA